MLSLLTLPRELRDKVLTLVISQPLPAPQPIPDISNRARLKDYISYSSISQFAPVHYLEHMDLRRPDTASLLLVNRQLHAETLEVLQILPSKHSYILDVVVAEYQGLFPTWLYVPQLTTRVDKVYVQFRSIALPGRSRSIFLPGDGGPPLLTFALYNLVERFLKVGPVGRQEGQGDKRICVKQLIINVLTPDVSPELISPPTMEKWGGRETRFREDGTPLMRHPKSVAAYIFFNMGMLLGKRDGHGEILYERIGTIRLLVDGEPFIDPMREGVPAEWDIADLLSRMRYWRVSEEQREKLLLWIKKIYTSRAEFGLMMKPEREIDWDS